MEAGATANQVEMADMAQEAWERILNCFKEQPALHAFTAKVGDHIPRRPTMLGEVTARHIRDYLVTVSGTRAAGVD